MQVELGIGEPGPSETFTHRGQEFVATIAPIFGVFLSVEPVQRGARSQSIKAAMLAFARRNRDRIEAAAQEWRE